MTRLVRQTDRFTLTMVAEALGRDLNVCLYGGDAPHIGAVAVAIPHPGSGTADRREVPVSLVTVPGHREDELAQRIAGELAQVCGGVVSVSCGIHLDHASRAEIEQVLAEAESLLEEFIGSYGTGPCPEPRARNLPRPGQG